MVDLLHEEQVANIVIKRKELLSTVMERTTEWVFSQEIPSDVIVNVGETSFSLHKFPLLTKCGYIRKLVAELAADQANTSVIQIGNIPGGAEAFELAAKFCYGINFEISTQNIAMIRCAAEYLEMTEDYAVGNLIGRTEAYLNEVALKSLPGAISILQASENFLPIAEKIKLVSRSINAIALLACKDSNAALLQITNGANELVPSNLRSIVDWWAEDLTNIQISLFHRVLMAMVARGFKHCALGPILMLYAQKSLRGLDAFGKSKKLEQEEEHEKRVVLETIVNLLPREKNTLSISFLSMLLKAAMYLQTTGACKQNLEMRIGKRLHQADLDDILIPSYAATGNVFDVETVQRMMTTFLEFQMESNRLGSSIVRDGSFSPLPSDMQRVAGLMESYLAEVASDRNLTVSKFISVAELIPEQSRTTEDGMYRAIDIYMKAHPDLSDMERKRVCNVMDCQKLSREACAHATQNDRLPVRIVIQVLYHEQQRIMEIVNSRFNEPAVIPVKPNPSSITDVPPVRDEVSTLREENQELRVQLENMRIRLGDVEKSSASGSPILSRVKTHHPRKSFMSSVSKRIGMIIRPPYVMTPQVSSSSSSMPMRDRRFSVS